MPFDELTRNLLWLRDRADGFDEDDMELALAAVPQWAWPEGVT